MDAASEDRLTGAEIAAVFYGHELEGRDLDRDESYWQSTAPDGTARIRLGTSSDTGIFRIEGNTYCVYWRIEHRHCNMVFRNPTGTLEKRNEYLQISGYQPHRVFGGEVRPAPRAASSQPFSPPTGLYAQSSRPGSPRRGRRGDQQSVRFLVLGGGAGDATEGEDA